MSFSADIKKIRLNSFMTQEDFANELNVTIITINRWETGKTRPALKVMKRIDDFCKKRNIDFDIRKLNEEATKNE